MKYNNEILNKIAELGNDNYANSIGLENLTFGYIELMKKGSKIHIKEKNKGKFSAAAKRAGQSVQEHARSIMNNPNATPLQKKRANFAIQAKRWHHKK